MGKLTKEMIQQGGHEYKNCKYLLEGIHLSADNILRPCGCKISKFVAKERQDFVTGMPTFTELLTSDTIIDKAFFDRMYEEKLNWILEANNSEKSTCNDCQNLNTNTWGAFPNFRINRIFFTHSYTCNCNCVYCDQDHAIPPNKRVIELLIKARDFGYLHDNRILEVDFSGGEPTLLPDFEGLFEYSKNARDKLQVLTTAIIFSEQIARLLANPNTLNTKICISIDSGTAETYKKVKKVAQFEKVVSNINKYYGAAIDKKFVNVKYIMIPENCSQEELDAFIKLVRIHNWQKASFTITSDKFAVNDGSENNIVLKGIEYLKEQLTKLTGVCPDITIFT